MKAPISVTNRKQTASFSIVSLMLAIASLWLMLAARAQTSNPSPGDWTQFHRDNMQRWNPYETVLGVGNVEGLQVKWKSAIVGSSPPAVVSGVVYIGSYDGTVYALNASTGAKLWSYATGANVYTSPAVANGIVYVASNDGNLYALNAGTGAKLWSFDTGGLVQSPTVVNGVVYVGSDDNNVYALNAGTGAKLWSYATGGLVQFSSPAVANGIVYVASNDGNLYALNANTGAKLWSYTAGGFVQSPAVANGVVYIISNYGTNIINESMYALDASTGARLWSTLVIQFLSSSSPAVANGVVYIGSDNGLVALDAHTGAYRWTFGIGNNSSSSPAVANGVVYYGGSDGDIYALNASTGAELWSYFVTPALFTQISSPTIVDGVVYMGAVNPSGNGNVYAFSLGSADLFLRIQPAPTTVHQGDLLTYAFPVWNLGPGNADHEVLNTQVPAGTTFDYVRISGTPALGTCSTPPYQGTGAIVCHENSSMASNTTWTVRLTVRVTAPSGTVIIENAATMADTPDPNLANNTATTSVKVQ